MTDSGFIRLRLSPAAAGWIAVLALVFGWYARQPLYHSDLWGHLAYGRFLWETHALPDHDPFMPLARDVPVVDTAWLSQVLMYGIEACAGLAGLQAWHGLTIAVCGALLVWPRRSIGCHGQRPTGVGHASCGLPSRDARTADFLRALAVAPVSRFAGPLVGPAVAPLRQLAGPLVGLAVWLHLEWFQLRIIRPQTVGLACFLTLISITTTRVGLRHAKWLVPALFVVWANLHGSFVMGIAWLVARALGRGLDVVRRTGRPGAILSDRGTRRIVPLAVLAVLATVVNPYGPRLWVEVLTFSANPNLRDVPEWLPLDWNSVQGRTCVGYAAALSVACVAARARYRWVDGLPLAVFGVATFCSARFVVWWAPLVAGFAMTALAWGRRGPLVARKSHDSFVWTAAALLAVMVALLISPWGRQAIPGRAVAVDEQVSARTPVAAVAFLRATRRRLVNSVFSRREWADYLVWAGPPGVQVFVTLHAHLAPSPIWRDYTEIASGSADCLALLDRYRIGAVLLDRDRQGKLAGRLEADANWVRVYDDRLAAVYERSRAVPPW